MRMMEGTAFIMLPCEDRDGNRNDELVHVDGISRVKGVNGKTVLVMRDSNDYDIWTTASMDDVLDMIRETGATLITRGL